MALIAKQKYDQSKVDKLAEYLRIYDEKGQPIDYEIIVDGLKAVRRTSDPAMFPMFENFVNGDTKSIEILFYTGSSNNNDKHIFTFKEDQKEGLSGLEIDSRIEEQVQRKLKEKEYDDLKRENENLQAEVEELEQEVEKLEKEKAEIVNSQSPLKGFLGEVGSSFVESFIRRNPRIISGIPGGEALAGLIEKDNKEKEQEGEQPESEVSFKAKSETHSLNKEDSAAITFVNQLKEQFSKEEFDNVLQILQALAENKNKITEVLSNITSIQ